MNSLAQLGQPLAPLALPAAGTKPLALLAQRIGWAPPNGFVKKLKPILNQHSLLLSRLTAISEKTTGVLWIEALSRAMTSMRSASTPESLQSIRCESREEIEKLRIAQRDGLKIGLRTLSAEATQLSLPVVASFLLLAEKHLTQIADDEQVRALAYGLPFFESPTLHLLRIEVQNLRESTEAIAKRPTFYGSPNGLLETFFAIE